MVRSSSFRLIPLFFIAPFGCIRQIRTIVYSGQGGIANVVPCEVSKGQLNNV